MRLGIAILLLLAARLAFAAGEFQIVSPAFASGEAIPAKYSRWGGNAIPPLVLSNPPAGTKSLAIVVADPDAPRGVWIHWLVANLPPGTTNLAGPAEGAVVGSNSWNAAQYDGPQPPAGTHHYVFQALALDALLPLPPGFSEAQLAAALKNHVLARAQLVGTFTK